MYSAYQKNDIKLFEQLANGNPDQEIVECNRPVLMSLCLNMRDKNVEYIKILLDNKANPNWKHMNQHLLPDYLHPYKNCNNENYCKVLDMLLQYGAHTTYESIGTNYNGIGQPTISLRIRYLIQDAVRVAIDRNDINVVLIMLKYNAWKGDFIVGVDKPSWKRYTFIDSLNRGLKNFYPNNKKSLVKKIINILKNPQTAISQYQQRIIQEQERLRREEQERLRREEQERLRREELRREEQERLRREELRREEQERLRREEQERLRREEQERLIQQERLRREEQERLRREEQERLIQQDRTAQEDEKKVSNKSYAYLALVIQNLEFLNNDNLDIPENLKTIISNMTSQLLIKTGQHMSKEVLDKVDIPEEYNDLINYKENITAFWEI
jgi:hypothetical protein